MSTKSLALVVLVELFFGVGQAVNLEHIHDSISHEPVQTDGTSKNARLDDLTLKDVTWTYSSTDSTTSLTVCTVEPFEGISQTVYQVTLVAEINDGPEISCEGAYDDVETNCATFIETGICVLDVPSGDVTYKLMVEVTAPLSTDVTKVGTANFMMSVEAATLTCGSTKFIRATGRSSAIVETCVAEGVDDVCYQMGDMAINPFCFTATVSEPHELTLCLKGDSKIVQTSDGELTITQLAYTPADSATFSLTLRDSASTPYEAIVLKDGLPMQSGIVTPDAESSGTFTIIGFTGDHAIYEVCTIIQEQLDVFQSALSSITDLDVQAAEDAISLQFRFTNANPDMKYEAKLDSDLPGVEPPTVVLDCTGVTQDHFCYGYLPKSIAYPFLTIEYLADDEASSNKIVFPNPGFIPREEST